MKILFTFAVVLVVLPFLVFVAGQLGLLRGAMPDDLGVRDGKLRPPSRTDNSVSSQASLYTGAGAEYARIEPLRYPVRGDIGPDPGAALLTRIGAIVLRMPGARIMQSGPDYLYVQFETKWLRFVDDAEFWAAPRAPSDTEGVVHVRSASRIGRRDFGVNRARIEFIREQLQAAAR